MSFSRALRSRCPLPIKAKSKLYVACVLSVALYGSEGWCETAANVHRLSVFHNRCCRALAKLNRWKQWKSKASTAQILQQVQLKKIEYYIDQRALRWIGHVARMPSSRLPKKLLFSWVPEAKRKKGRAQKHYGHRVKQLIIDLVAQQSAADRRNFRLSRDEKPWWPINGCNRANFNESWSQCAHWMRQAQSRTEWKRYTNAYLDSLV